MSLQEAERQRYILTIGFQDTSAAFISALVNYIIEFPEIGSKVLDEISLFERSGKPSSPVVTYDETVGMQYFMACFHETLRLAPLVSITLPRYAPAGGIYINGSWISERAELAASRYVIHRHTEIFGSDADTFRPERWLGDPDHVRLMHRFSLTYA
jgi:cytochrome P450